MKRVLTYIAIVIGCSLATVRPAAAQKAAEIDYLDPVTKKQVTVTDQIVEETNAGIKVKGGKLIPALAIVHVTYPTGDPITFRAPFRKEAKALLQKPVERKITLAAALTEYQQLEKEIRSQPNAFRYIQYRIVQLKVLQAQDEPENNELMRTALDALKTYKDAHPDGWEYIPCLTLSAKIFEGQGDTDAALDVYKALLDITDLSKDMRRECEMLSAQLLVRKRRFKEAETKFKSIADKLGNDDPQKALIHLYLVESRLAQDKTDNVEDPAPGRVAIRFRLQGQGDGPQLPGRLLPQEKAG